MDRFVQRMVRLAVAAGACTAFAAHALQVTSLTPQGEVAAVRQVVAKFDEAAVNFGDPKAPAPLTVSCDDAQASKGTGRWTSEREWVFDLQQDLPPGLRCTVQPVASFRSAKGQPLTAQPVYRFTTGGPFVRQTFPGTWAPIEEEQFFVFGLSGDAAVATVQPRMWCQVEGVGEQVPIRLLTPAEKAPVLKALGLEAAVARKPLAYVAFACNRRLPAGARVQVVYGKGIATPSGVPNSVEKAFTYRVRPAFAAEFSCERENAQSPCVPIRPLRLQFSAPVARKMAERIQLVGPKGTLRPTLEGGQDGDATVQSVTFSGVPQEAELSLQLPRDFVDASGRTLRNAQLFPLKVRTGMPPPLAKFAASPFGIVERLADPGSPPLLPLTVRRVESELRVQEVQPRTDAEIIEWHHRLEAANNASREDRETPYLTRGSSARKLELPKPSGRGDQAGERPFEVVGIPLTPGFHVVEIASQALGTALLSEELGPRRTMYVRTSALVTNLAVHFKLGRENSLAWVTTLHKGQPVAGARVAVSGCDGGPIASGTTDARGIVQLDGIPPRPPHCRHSDGYFVSARARAADGVDDLAFTWSGWQRGIEAWRFNVPVSDRPEPDLRAHTILDRSLVRAGETVSMKHLMRTETRNGFGLPATLPPTQVVTHVGSGQQYTVPLEWRKTATGGTSAVATFAVPQGAKLGLYQVSLQGGGDESYDTAEFRVEEFRLPVLEGRIGPAGRASLVNVRELPTQVQVNYVSGGPAVNLPVRVSALLRTRDLAFADYDAFSFSPPVAAQQGASSNEAQDEMPAGPEERVVADKLPVTLDRAGSGKLTLPKLPAVREPKELLLEATYPDPNGEIQTLRSIQTLWPAAVIAGIRTEGWVSARQQVKFQALALDLTGRALADVPLEVRATARVTTSSRKRMVGGFYSYDNHTETKDLGVVCSGRSDVRGLLLCEAQLGEPGQVELVASARDGSGNVSRAASSVWVTRQGELWFGGEDHDRIDVLPEKKSYQPGETARLQVRMPFRFATALVSVEREGILQSEVVQLNGQDPTVSVKISDRWAPNVYVSVLVLRGRLREVPWYSFFTWGYKAPREWWTAFWYEGREYVAPTALVDLSKPAYRLGLAELRVGSRAHQLDVKVSADKDSYQVRGTARVTITAKLPDGRPAAGAEVALAAVDQALLELMPNTTWNLLDAMLKRRSWGVQTSTAQMEIIGRRHYGRKAVPAGGGGGGGAVRELLDTLLVWKPRVVLDANGRAVVDVPLNDALTTFRIVAVADASTGLFGTGQTTIRSTQDLQIISGLPPLVRDDDSFRAQVTLRNTTAKAMKVQVKARATMLDVPPLDVEVPAGEAREVAWNVQAPAALALTNNGAILWEIEARDTVGGARDALKARQKIVPSVPLTVQQATLVQLDAPFSLDVARPAGALPGRGGLKLALQPKLAEGLPGVKDWFANYPFICLEQKTSKAIGLRDAALWQSVAAQIPSYLDADGLAAYFPPRDGESNRGSDTLTAYILAASHEASRIDPAFALPDAVRAPMEQALVGFVEGRITRKFWSPRADLDARKLAALEALSRYGKAEGRMVSSITIAPNQWPTHSVIAWISILKRVPDVPQREQRLAEATQVLKARLSFQGTKLLFSTERDDYWWWLMVDGDLNTARLLLAVLDDPAWKDDLGRLANGFIGRQQGGAWHTTTSNLWGGLALEKFSAKFESAPVAGTTRATTGTNAAAVDWSKVERIKATDPQGAAHQTTFFGAPAAPGNLKNNTAFLPWAADGGKQALAVQHQGSGRPWLTLQSIAAVPLQQPFSAGYQVARTITPVEQAVKGRYTRGDVLRISVQVTASADMTWVVLSDPVPGGATILGTGLGRDSSIASAGEKREGWVWPAFEERSFEAFRSYYEYVPKGTFKVEYTVRLNNVGDFALPPTRVEAMYAPEMFGELPNARMKVEAAK